MEKEFLEEQLAAGRSLEQIGQLVGKDASTVGYWVAKHGLVAVGREKYAPRGGLPHDQLVALVDAGMSTREIARECSVSYSTARYWLKRHGLETERVRHRASYGPKARRVERRCKSHGITRFVLEGRGYYRCAKCRMDRVADRRRRVKKILVEEAGGRCRICGFDGHPAALEFHHLDPSQKNFTLSRGGVTRSIEELRVEARKCVLLCANCHAEVEVGARTLVS
jgi:Homeodomain-like domain-containing protein